MTNQENRFPDVKPRRRSSLKRQRLAVLITLGVVVVLAVTFGLVWRFTTKLLVEYPNGDNVVDADGTKYYSILRDGVWVMENQHGDACATTSEGLYKTKDGTIVQIDSETGKATVIAAVLLNGTETVRYDYVNSEYDVLLYPMLERADIQSIEVKNSKDHFTFIRTEDGTFVLKDQPKTPYSSTMFATLVVVTGYTNTIMRLDLSESNPDAEGFRRNGYAEYGLPEDPDAAENYFVITALDGTVHKVLIGDLILDDTGYYARYAGRDEVYILKQMEESEYNATLSATLLGSLEDYVTPTVTTTIGSSDYFDVIDFTIWAADGTTTVTDLSTFKQMIKFSYEPIERRKGTFYANIPYMGKGRLDGYAIDDYQADICLQNLMDMVPNRTVKLYRSADTESNLELFVQEYGVAYAIEFIHVPADSRKGAEGDYEPIRDKQMMNQIWVSPPTRHEDGSVTYYMFNELFNMVVETDREFLEFLGWSDDDWISDKIFSGSIAYLEKVDISIKGGTTAGITGIQNISFSLGYVDSQGNATNSTENGAELRVSSNLYGQLADTMRFKRFYQVLLAATLSGQMSSGSEAAQEALKGTTPDLEMTLVYQTEEGTLTRTYRMYSHTGPGGGGNAGDWRGAYVTVNGLGNFYMNQSYVDKIIADVGRILSTDPADEIKI